MARIRAALRRAAPREDAGIFSLGDLKVHPRSLRAARGEDFVDLTPREVAMLRLLHDNRGQPVSRDAFLDTCWGADYFPDSRTLDQHILMLRKKIELNSAKPHLIKTVRSVGYIHLG